MSTYPDNRVDQGRTGGWHTVNVGHLVMGLAFLGLAAVWAAVQLGSRAEMRGKRVVAILPDSGDRYISTPFFSP